MKDTFDKKKVGCKAINEFQVGELVWFNVQRRMPDMKYNKAKWIGHVRYFQCWTGSVQVVV